LSYPNKKNEDLDNNCKREARVIFSRSELLAQEGRFQASAYENLKESGLLVTKKSGKRHSLRINKAN